MKFKWPVYNPTTFDATDKEIEMLDPLVFDGAEKFISALYPDLYFYFESLMQTVPGFSPEQMLFGKLLPEHTINMIDMGFTSILSPTALEAHTLVLDITQFELHGQLNITDRDIVIPAESFDQTRLICLKIPAGLMSTLSGVPYRYHWFTLFPSSTEPGRYYPVEIKYNPRTPRGGTVTVKGNTTKRNASIEIYFHYERIWRTWCFRHTASTQYVLPAYITLHTMEMNCTALTSATAANII